MDQYKINFINLFKNCLNILRDNEGLTGEKALKNVTYLLVLKLLEPHLIEIKIDDYIYDFSHIEDNNIEKHKNELLSVVRFRNLAKEPTENIPTNIKYLWNDILSNHPSTKNIFIKGKEFDIHNQSTFRKLIDKINLLDINDLNFDILGSLLVA